MVEKGLQERTRDPEDWRTVRLALAPAGEELLRLMTARRAELIAQLSEEETATVLAAIRVLERLVERRP